MTCSRIGFLIVCFSGFRLSNACGVLWFLHVPKTGGSSVNRILKNVCTHQIDVGCWNWQSSKCLRYNWQSILPELKEAISNRKKGEINCFRHHHNGPFMVDIIHHIDAWRKTANQNGCQFVLATMFREPIKRLLSEIEYNMPRTFVSQHVHSPANINVTMFMEKHSNAQIRYFLFNHWRRITAYQGQTSRNGLPIVLNLHDRNDVPWVDIALNLTKHFDIIGFLDNMTQFINSISDRFKVAKQKVLVENKSKKYPALEAKWLSAISASSFDIDVQFWRKLTD